MPATTSSPAFKNVYKLVKQIPKGKVTTYGMLAKKLHLSPRTVGHILHLNPDGAQTPCHRVVNRDGRVAPGYAFGGPGIQKTRLEEEGIVFKDNEHIELQKYYFNF